MIYINKISTIKLIDSTDIKRGIRKGLQSTKQYLVGNKGGNSGLIKQEMLKPKTGRTYIVSKRGLKKLHTASNASGQESSAVLTGTLKRSISGQVQGSNRLIISADTPYARIQEKGGKNLKGAKVEARNNFSRPILSSRGQIKNIISRELNNIK